MSTHNNSAQKQHKFKRLGMLRTVSVFLLVSIVLINISVPRPANAQGAPPTLDIIGSIIASGDFTSKAVPGAPVKDVSSDVRDTASHLGALLKGGLITAGKIGVKNAMRSFMEKLAYKTAVWLGSGDSGQKPLLFTKNAGEYIKEAGDAAGGEFLNALASENGFVELNLCDLPELEKLKFQITLPKLIGAEPYKPSCSYSEIKQSFKDYKGNLMNKYAAFADDPQSLVQFTVGLDKGSNALSSLLDSADKAIGANAKAEKNAELERLKSEFKDSKEAISEYIKTPAGIVEIQADTVISHGTDPELTLTDDIFADALSIFYRTLSAKLLENATSGIMSFLTKPDVAGSLAGDSSPVGSRAGRAGAEERFASFKTTSFNKGGQIQILSHFANCPNDGAGTTNCVVDEQLRLTIDEGMSLREAVDQKILDPATAFAFSQNGDTILNPIEGISLRNIKILKSYDVVPVGWVLAAEYNKDFGGESLTIQSVMDAFDDCTVDNYSPYCGLVDPDWPMKAPEVFCNAEGYSNTINIDRFIDTDASPYTPSAHLVNRQTSCVDSQTCLEEDDSGFCKAYGYCTKQERVYRFEGESCPAYEATCQTYTNDQGDEVAYLQNTLNFNDCSASNVGCTWYCTEYNAIDEDFRCAGQGELYTVCDSSQGSYDSGSNTCSCTVESETCSISGGGFKCTTEAEKTCTLGVQSDSTTGIDSTINFDNDVRTCDEENGGCTEFIEFAGSSNILFNGNFEHFNTFHPDAENGHGIDALDALVDEADTATTNYDDTFGYYGSEANSDIDSATIAGQPCSEYSVGSQKCYGWEYVNGVAARAVDTSLAAEVGMQIRDASLNTNIDTGYIVARVETNQPLANRSFALSYNYKNAGTECTAQFWVAPNGADSSVYAQDITYGGNTDFTQVTADLVTFAPDITETKVVIGITEASGCNPVLDSVKLEEFFGSSGFTDYGDERISLNLNKAQSCSVDEVGCQLFTPRTGESNTDVPGIATNPNSEVCGYGDDYTNPECSQCIEKFVGCDAFIEVESPYEAPIKDISKFSNPGSYDQAFADAVAKRTGYYCENSTTACNPSIGCDGAAACLPSISIVPKTGQTCSAANVGCEQYVNIAEESAGGEALEYYSYIRQCVRETQDQLTNGELETYYTFEGSDDEGYQLSSHYLKKSNQLVDTNSDGTPDGFAPCTRLDLYDADPATVATVEATCVDSQFTEAELTCSISSDPDCREFFDSEGRAYYRRISETITVSDECTGLRNTLDNRTYYTIPAQSTSCPASANMCREYRGSQGGNVQLIIEENFDSGPWVGGQASNTTVTANSGQSMALGTTTTTGSTDASQNVGDLLKEDQSYVASFWAKAEDGQRLDVYFKSLFATDPLLFDENGVTLTSDWKQYTVGPFVFAEGTFIGDEEFGFRYQGSTAYIDTVELRRSDSYYLIAGSAESCIGSEGCEKYTDTDNSTYFLKSFAKLCDESKVGCAALFKTNESDSPFFESFNADNEFTEANGPNDDVNIDTDSVVFYAVQSEAMCDESFAGCQLLGEPTIDENNDPESYTRRYLVNDPDEYDTALCQEHQRECAAWSVDDGSISYFKDPENKYCTFDTNGGKWITQSGADCPLQNEHAAAAPSQPLGPICNGGARANQMCQTDTDCPIDPDVDPADAQYRCVNNLPDSGYAGQCSTIYSGCTMYVDPDTTGTSEQLPNGQFESDVADNDDITSGDSDGIPDDWAAIETHNPDISNNYYFQSIGSPGAYGCDVVNGFNISTEQVFEGDFSMKLERTSGAAQCMVGPDVSFFVNEDSYYTLSGNIYTTSADAQFSIGLLFYDSNGDEIYAGDNPNTYAFAAYEGSGRSTVGHTVPANEWVRFYGLIGPNIDTTFPEGTYFVQMFIETSDVAGGDFYVDNVSFAKNGEYTYVDHTIDGTPESESNSCNGTIDIAKGCVGFRDVTNTNLTDLASIEKELIANQSYVQEPCTFNGADGTEKCTSQPNAADTNVVIKVANDRQCAEWLGCYQGILSDTNGDGEDDKVTCLELGLCTERNPVSGVCTEWSNKIDEDYIGDDDDLTVISQPGNTKQVHAIENMSGYATAGVEWIGVCGTTNTCIGGKDAGAACTDNNDCANAQITLGYYPYELMPQRGQGGAVSSEDLVQDGQFENVTCSGEGSYTDVTWDYTDQEYLLESVRNRYQRCTQDLHCRTADTEAKMQQIIQNAQDKITTGEVNYQVGYCDNVDEGGWGSWQTNSASQMRIIDFDEELKNSSEYAVVRDDTLGSAFAASTVDLNNILYVQPEDNAATGVYVNLGEEAVNGQEYTVTFDARYMSNAKPETDLIEVGIYHGDLNSGGDFTGSSYDVFEPGTPMADIIFVVDVSGSMSAEIGKVATGTSALVAGLEEKGIDFQIGIVTTGGPNSVNSSTVGTLGAVHVLDYADYADGYGTNAYQGSDGVITRDFTQSVDEFSQVMAGLSANLAGPYENNYEALVEVAHNSFAHDTNADGEEYQLQIRPGAEQFVVLLTDDIPQNNTDPYVGSAYEEADESALINVLGADPFTLNSIVTINGTVDQAYNNLTSQYGGNLYNINESDYTDLLADIVKDMAEETDYFTFTNNMRSYALGPIAVNHKRNSNDTSYLYIRQVEGSSNVPFVIDNVSMKPALELNQLKPSDYKDDVHAGRSSWLVGRECRVYPEADSPQCQYQNDSGVFFSGWQGYCLERDDLNRKQCALWWPVDVIAGEPDSSSSKTLVEYNGKYPAYHCLVAKGNAYPAVCEGGTNNGLRCGSGYDCPSGTCLGGRSEQIGTCYSGGDIGKECTSNADCPAGEVDEDDTCKYVVGDSDIDEPSGYFCSNSGEVCQTNADCDSYNPGQCGFGGASPGVYTTQSYYMETKGDFNWSEYSDDDMSKVTYDITHTYDNNSPYQLKHTLDRIYIDTVDPHGTNGESFWGEDSLFQYDHEYAFFNKIDKLPIEDTIHISEIDNIVFDMGNAYYPETPSGSTVFQAWDLKTKNIDFRQDLEAASASGGSEVLYKGAEDTATYDPATNTWEESDLKGDTGDNTERRGYVAFHKGAWCTSGSGADGLCDEFSSGNELSGMDLVFTKLITSKVERPSVRQNDDNKMWSVTDPQPYNPFNELSKLSEGSSVWSNNGGKGTVGFITDDGNDDGPNTVDGQSFTSPFWLSAEIEDVNENYNKPYKDNDPDYDVDKSNNKCFGKDPCGANIMGVKFDFEGGYLDAIYLFFWDGFHRFDAQNISNISWTIYLKEPCLLAVEGVDEFANITPWMERVTSGTSYRVPEINLAHTMVGVNSLYGSWRAETLTKTPYETDGQKGERTGTEWLDVTADVYDGENGNDLPVVRLNTEVGSVVPFACLGQCGETVCQGDVDHATGYYATYNGSISACDDGWIGVAGVCEGVPEFCTSGTDCSDGSACQKGWSEAEGADSDNNTYKEQLAAAAEVGWQRYRQVFADLQSNTVFYAAESTGLGIHESTFSEGSITDDSEGSNDASWLYNSFNDDDDAELDYDDMQICPGITRDSDQYCAFSPTISNITVNGEKDKNTLEIERGTPVTLQFDSFVDPDQEPLHKIRIAWQGSLTDQSFAFEDFQEITWDAASTPNHRFTRVYNCDPVAAAQLGYWDEVEQTCDYKIKIQIEDNWQFCSGVKETAVTRRGDDACTSYDEFKATLKVKK